MQGYARWGDAGQLKPRQVLDLGLCVLRRIAKLTDKKYGLENLKGVNHTQPLT
jgi:hypothetical protein